MLHLKTKNCLLRSNCIFRFLFIHSNEHDLYFCEPFTQVKTPLEYLSLLKINIFTTIAKSPPLTLSATFTNTLVNHMNMLRKKQHHNIFPLQTSSTSLAMSNVRSSGRPERRWFTLWRMSAVRVRLSPAHELSGYYDSTEGESANEVDPLTTQFTDQK